MAGFSKFWEVFPGLAKLPVTGNNKKRDRDILHEDHEKGNRVWALHGSCQTGVQVRYMCDFVHHFGKSQD